LAPFFSEPMVSHIIAARQDPAADRTRAGHPPSQLAGEIILKKDCPEGAVIGIAGFEIASCPFGIVPAAIIGWGGTCRARKAARFWSRSTDLRQPARIRSSMSTSLPSHRAYLPCVFRNTVTDRRCSGLYRSSVSESVAVPFSAARSTSLEAAIPATFPKACRDDDLGEPDLRVTGVVQPFQADCTSARAAAVLSEKRGSQGRITSRTAGPIDTIRREAWSVAETPETQTAQRKPGMPKSDRSFWASCLNSGPRMIAVSGCSG